PVDHVDSDAEKEQPHRGEMPEQCRRQSIIIVHALSTCIITAKGEPHRKPQKIEQRLLVVDAPAAADQDDDAQRPGPVQVADPAGMQDYGVSLWLIAQRFLPHTVHISFRAAPHVVWFEESSRIVPPKPPSERSSASCDNVASGARHPVNDEKNAKFT